MGGTALTVPPPQLGETVNKLRGGSDRWDKKLVGGDFGLQKSNICKIRFCMFNIYFHKNICFTVFLNSAGFCDSAMVNIGC